MGAKYYNALMEEIGAVVSFKKFKFAYIKLLPLQHLYTHFKPVLPH